MASGRAVLQALVDADVRFLIVGGLAVNVHGYMPFTLDIDVVVKLASDNIARAFGALALVGYLPTVPVSAEQFGVTAIRESWVRDKNMRVLRFHSDGSIEAVTPKRCAMLSSVSAADQPRLH